MILTSLSINVVSNYFFSFHISGRTFLLSDPHRATDHPEDGRSSEEPEPVDDHFNADRVGNCEDRGTDYQDPP